MPIVPANQSFGSRRGVGPLLFVFPGESPPQFSFGPHPKFPPPTMRLISSLHSGPFSVSHRLPVCGSNVNPNELRMPNAKILLPAIGLSDGHASGRRHAQDLAAEVADRSWAFELSWPSPTIAYSMPSGPNRMRPPLWYGLELAGCETSTRMRACPFERVTFRIWFCRPLDVERVAYT